MPARRSLRNLSQETQKKPEKPTVIEILSDSEPEASAAEDEVPETGPKSPEAIEQPLMRAAGIKYKTDKSEKEAQQDSPESTPRAKLSVRVKDTGSVKHRHVSIEIPLPTSSDFRRKTEDDGSEEENVEEVFKTPRERKHITFDDMSDHDEYVTPREAPSRNPLESNIPKSTQAEDDDEEEEEESDDEAPEAVSTRAAGAENQKAAEAAAKAAEKQAAALKRKRQERDAFFKQQAEERKRTQKPAAPEDSDEDVAEPAEEKKAAVPKLLSHFLESDDEDDMAQQVNSAADGKNKRRKLGSVESSLLRQPKLPKDKRVGSTAYRVVAGAGDGRLAPKVKQQSRNLKDTLLRRDRVAQSKGGFFVR
ncbi:hypothetical protein N0V88_001753 [Collariella sp. IMI 366227]|nr:hypothetical protein N0V88_001753 [Collariella sp. IMI 366227]